VSYLHPLCEFHWTIQQITAANNSRVPAELEAMLNAIFIGASAKNPSVGSGSSRHSNSQHFGPARNLLQNCKTWLYIIISSHHKLDIKVCRYVIPLTYVGTRSIKTIKHTYRKLHSLNMAIAVN